MPSNTGFGGFLAGSGPLFSLAQIFSLPLTDLWARFLKVFRDLLSLKSGGVTCLNTF